MFIVFQIPVVDGRKFLGSDKTQLKKPSWSGIRDVGREFLRYMGPMQERFSGGINGWPTEDIFCNAARWLRFDPLRSFQLYDDGLKLASGRPVFRRWLSDGRIVSRLELGWRFRGHFPSEYHPSMTANILRAFFSLQVQLCSREERRLVSLRDLSHQAFKAYIASSTKYRVEISDDTRLVIRPGRSVVYFEFCEEEIEYVGYGWQPVGLETGLVDGVEIWTNKIRAGGQSIIAYALKRTGSRNPENMIRMIRLNLMRMHAELEGLEQLSSWMKQLWINQNSKQRTELLTDHFREALKRLRPDRGPLADHVGFRIARRAIEVGCNGRIDFLLDEIRDYCDSTDTKLRSLIRMFYSDKIPDHFNLDITMNKTENTNNVSGNSGQVSIAQAGARGSASVTASFNSNAQTFKDAIASIEEAFDTVLPKIADSEARSELQTRLKDLKKEGKDRKWYEVSAEGLKEAAVAVGQIAAPITAAVTALLSGLPEIGK